MKISDWGWEQINGFYKYCKDTITDVGLNFDFGYIHNPSGGFYGMWMYDSTKVDADGLECEVYLQSNFLNGVLDVCYRASSKEQKIQRKNRDALVWKNIEGTWVDIAKKHNFRKPKRYGTGKSVALGVYNITPETYEEAVNVIRHAVEDFRALVKDIKML